MLLEDDYGNYNWLEKSLYKWDWCGNVHMMVTLKIACILLYIHYVLLQNHCLIIITSASCRSFGFLIILCFAFEPKPVFECVSGDRIFHSTSWNIFIRKKMHKCLPASWVRQKSLLWVISTHYFIEWRIWWDTSRYMHTQYRTKLCLSM